MGKFIFGPLALVALAIVSAGCGGQGEVEKPITRTQGPVIEDPGPPYDPPPTDQGGGQGGSTNV